MTVFIVSHNLQITSVDTPSLTGRDIASGLMNSSTAFKTSTPLDHPHWLVKLESDLEVSAMAEELIKAWKNFRLKQGHSTEHAFLALGGRKDSVANSASPLQAGYWGVDFVECQNSDQFLESINWNALKAGRPIDAVFEARG